MAKKRTPPRTKSGKFRKRKGGRRRRSRGLLARLFRA